MEEHKLDFSTLEKIKTDIDLEAEYSDKVYRKEEEKYIGILYTELKKFEEYGLIVERIDNDFNKLIKVTCHHNKSYLIISYSYENYINHLMRKGFDDNLWDKGHVFKTVYSRVDIDGKYDRDTNKDSSVSTISYTIYRIFRESMVKHIIEHKNLEKFVNKNK